MEAENSNGKLEPTTEKFNSEEEILEMKNSKKSSSIKDKFIDVLKNITIEPAMFLLTLSSGLDDPLIPQFIITKICTYDFGYNETVCDDENLVTEFQEENDKIQKEYATFNVYMMMVYTLFPIFFSFYLGSWCDIFGRKLLIKIYLMSKILAKCGVIVLAYFMNSSKYWILLCSIPYGIAGGEGVFSLALNALMADITKPENLAFRLGMIGLSGALAAPISPIIGAYIYSKFGYIGLFSASNIGVLCAGIFLLIRIHPYKWKPAKEKVERSAFSIKHPIDCLKTVFKRREGPNRKYILLFITIITMWIILIIGESGLAQPYMRTRYEWYYPQIAQYTSITRFTSLAVQALLIPMVKFLELSESLLMVVIMTLGVARQFIQGLAKDSWMFYLGALIDSMGQYNFSILTAMQIACVPQDEIGKISAARTALEMILPVPFNFLYVKIWSLTSLTYPSAIFLFSGGIAFIATVLTMYIYFSLHGKSMAEVTAVGASRQTDEEKEEGKLSPKQLQPVLYKITSI